MAAGVDVDDLERLLDGALDEFDSGLAEQQGGARQDHVPDVLTGASESENQPDTTIIYHASGSAQCSPAPGKGPTFNPLGRRPKKEKPPALPPPAINDLSDVSQEELESSAKELAAMLQNMMKENQPADSFSAAAPTDSAASMMSTLDQVNQAARKAAEGSTGTWSSPNLASAGASAEDVPGAEAEEMQKMLEMMQGAMGGGAGGGGGEVDSFVDTLMHGILCKDVLYEPLKDVGKRYPKWLEDNEGKIPADEFQQHTAQQAHINAICKLLEEHGDTKFDELLKLLQELQAMGQPPQELLAEMQAANGSSAGQGGLGGDLGALGQQCPMQ